MAPDETSPDAPPSDDSSGGGASRGPQSGATKPGNTKPGDGKPSDGKPKSSDKPPRSRPVGPSSFIVLLLLGLTLLMIVQQFQASTHEISYSFFHEQVLAGNIAEARVDGRRVYGKFRNPPLAPAQSATDGNAEPDAAPAPETEPSETESPENDEASPQPPPANDDAGSDDKGGAVDQSANEKDTTPEDDAGRLPQEFFVIIPGFFDEQLRQELVASGAELEGVEPVDWSGLFTLVWFGLLIGLAIMMISFFRRTRDQMMGGGMLGGVTKSPAKRYEAEEGPKTTFDDVAGLKGVKKDLKEIVDFLRDPERFRKLGARVPKGVLLNGPPGTGKTLLAKAVAGEAGVPFFSISGSEFIQMFVGVGASRVRDMFKTAKKSAPAILFIDEIDAVGRQRGAGLGGGHDEREQTLNQILSEMDGFEPSETVIVMAATNRPDVLDPALLRPGRFDRHITVDRPSIEGRTQLFEVHTREVPVADDVDFDKLARATAGLTGADIANLVNEAALWATRHEKNFVTMDDFEFARDKILMGSAREEVLTENEKKITAFHEAGHTLVAWMLPDCDRVHKVTIIPRGRALGVTQLVPEEDRHNMAESEMYARLAMSLAGRAAEKLVFDEFSAGAENDLERATKLARRMVTHWGMSERIGPVAYHNGGDDPFLGREIVQEQRQYSEHTAQIIDDEVARILHAAADRATSILTDHRDKLDAITSALLEREEIDDDEIAELIGPAIQAEPSTTTTLLSPHSPATPEVEIADRVSGEQAPSEPPHA